MGLLLTQLNKLFESDSLKRRAISFLLVKDEHLFAFHLGEISRQRRLLKASAQNQVLRVEMLFLKSVWQFVVKLIRFLH
jgi:hypothetical protein